MSAAGHAARLAGALLLPGLLAGCFCERKLLMSTSGVLLAVGDSAMFQAAVVRSCSDSGYPSSYQYDNFDTPYRFVWTSSDPSVAEVDYRGMIRAVSPGEARVAATSGSLAGTPLRVTVRPREAQSVRATKALR